ncbi:hypothetical protein GCM10009424_24820 [Sphingomonas ursincola]|jgi:hypothetical protein|uniref:DUF2505 domain-containing protein n=1 Tax=Sphingomonas ursincola TaxID=56361 RepID=A0A7V8U7X4_9SPHN|nr:DUF2505 domain-containing protein [Sphingomonas ursincola]MBA1373775.1 DUF2505 domain-containing protein [Sphingomonas ursincola]MBY0621014.1 DUF2505 domain-containing protein [Sphingomonas ursincola]
MLKREENHVFAAPVEAVVARWTDADFLTGMMQDQGSREISVTVEHLSSDQIQVAITRQVPVDAPAMIRAVIGSWLDLTQRDVWTRAADGSWSAVRDAKPKGLSAEGQCLLTLTGNADGGATCAAIVSVQSRAPMVAAMVESLMLEDSTKLLRQEFAAVDAASG